MKKIFSFLITILVVTIVVILGSLLIEGVPVTGLKNTDEIVSVELTHGDYAGVVKEYTDSEDIELAVSLLRYLNFSPIKGLSDDNRLITITNKYIDGTEFIISANNYTVFINGKARALSDDETFVKMCTAIFFSEE